MPPKPFWAPPSKGSLCPTVDRGAIAIVLLLLSVPASTFAVEEGPAPVPAEERTFDRFDRIIVRFDGLAQAAHVESRRRHTLRGEDGGNDDGGKILVELRFSQGVFENFAFGPKEDEEAVFRRLESDLAYRVLHLGRMFKLDEVQQKKLLQAGRGDLQRIREQIKELKKRFAEPGLIEEGDPTAVRTWAEALVKEAVTLRATMARADMFHKGSMLEKVLRRQLSPEQIVDYDAHEDRVRGVSPQSGKKARTGIGAVQIR